MRLIDKVIFQKWHIEIALMVNKESSLTEIALIDSDAEAKHLQLINHKLPNICTKVICFETIKDLSFKVFLIHFVLEIEKGATEKGIATNVHFILSFIPKEIYSRNNVTILKDIDKERIYRTGKSFSSLKTEISLDDPLTDNDIKRLKQDDSSKTCTKHF